jgi:hypothetical protein
VLQLLEEKAIQFGASRATLDTIGFQAEKLYEKTPMRLTKRVSMQLKVQHPSTPSTISALTHGKQK